jgi:(2Fe-2S) ferredoxin
MGTVCYLKGSDKIFEAICKEFNVEAGGTTPDRLFSFQPVNCVGACALAPVMIIDGDYYDGVTPDKALQLLNRLTAEEQEETPQETKPRGVKPKEKAPKAKVSPAGGSKPARVDSKMKKEGSK